MFKKKNETKRNANECDVTGVVSSGCFHFSPMHPLLSSTQYCDFFFLSSFGFCCFGKVLASDVFSQSIFNMHTIILTKFLVYRPYFMYNSKTASCQPNKFKKKEIQFTEDLFHAESSCAACCVN